MKLTIEDIGQAKKKAYSLLNNFTNNSVSYKDAYDFVIKCCYELECENKKHILSVREDLKNREFIKRDVLYNQLYWQEVRNNVRIFVFET